MRSLFLLLSVLLVVTGCPDGDDRPCRSDENCDAPEVCVFEDVDDQIGQCSDDLPSVDGGQPLPQNDGGVPIVPPPETDAGSPGFADVLLPPSTNAVAIAVGSAHACAILDTGEVSCWGSNNSGQTRNNNTPINDFGPPAIVAEISNATHISAGDFHTCVKADGFEGPGVYCFGRQSEGQLGRAPGSVEFVKAELGAIDTNGIVALDSVEDTNYLALSNGDVHCFGEGCGDGVTSQPRPFHDGAIKFDLGANHICSANENDMRCEAPLPGTDLTCTNLAGGVLCPGIDDVTASSNASCSIGATNECAGENGYGLSSPSTTAVGHRSSNPGLGSIVMGSSQAFCTLVSERVRCWGRNLFGSTGQVENFGTECAVAPSTLCHDIADVPQTQGAIAMDYNVRSGCALLENGSVTCWGEFQSQTPLAPTNYSFD